MFDKNDFVACADRIINSDPTFLMLKLLPAARTAIYDVLWTYLDKKFPKLPGGISRETKAQIVVMALLRIRRMIDNNDLTTADLPLILGADDRREKLYEKVCDGLAPLFEHNFTWVDYITNLALVDSLLESPKRFVEPPQANQLPVVGNLQQPLPTFAENLRLFVERINKIRSLVDNKMTEKEITDLFYRQFQTKTPINSDFLKKLLYLKNIFEDYAAQPGQARFQEPLQPAVNLLRNLYECAKKNYIAQEVERKHITLSLLKKFQDLLMSHAVESVKDLNDPPAVKEQKIKDKLEEWKTTFLNDNPEPEELKPLLLDDYEACVKIAEYINAALGVHSRFLSLPVVVTLEDDSLNNFVEEETAEEEANFDEKFKPQRLVLHSATERAYFRSACNVLERIGQSKEGEGKPEKGRALVTLANTLRIRADEHYIRVHVFDGEAYNAKVAELRNPFRARVIDEIQTVYNSQPVAHHCNYWKRAFAFITNVCLAILAPAGLMKKYLTTSQSFFVKPETRTQMALTVTEENFTDILTPPEERNNSWFPIRV